MKKIVICINIKVSKSIKFKKTENFYKPMNQQQNLWSDFAQAHGKTYGIDESKRYEYRTALEETPNGVAALYENTAFAFLKTGRGLYFLAGENFAEGTSVLDALVRSNGGIETIICHEPLAIGKEADAIIQAVISIRKPTLSHLIPRIELHLSLQQAH